MADKEEGGETAENGGGKAKKATRACTPRAKVLGRMIAAGIVGANEPVTYGMLSRIFDAAENNDHGKAYRKQLDREWDAMRHRTGVGREDAVSLQGNKDAASDKGFEQQAKPKAEKSAVYVTVDE